MILREIYNNTEPTTEFSQLSQLKARYPWWNTVRLMALRTSHGSEDVQDNLIGMLHPTATLPFRSVDYTKITRLSEEDIIDRFLQRSDYRIVAEEGDAEDMTSTINCDDEDMVSEELAEIYEKQGLYDDAIATYRALSLLNSEKSIYFAGLIAKLEAMKSGKR